MLGQKYNYYLDCCGKLQFKRQILEIKLEGAGGNQAQTSQAMFRGGPSKTCSQGRVYINTYLSYYCCCVCCCDQPAFEVEFEEEKFLEAIIPICCQCCGPFPVFGKQKTPLGEYQPHCYICKPCVQPPCASDCIHLTVHDASQAEIYNIKRECCTCGCCTTWNVFDNGLNQVGQIKQTGCFCPNYEVTLPQASETNKALVLGTLVALP